MKGAFSLSVAKKTIETFGITSIINYLRKSRQDEEREKKTGEDTLHEQKKLMDRVLSEFGLPYEQRPEIGSGDKIATRPVFKQVIIDLDRGKFDAIAVKEISRMGRGSYTDMGTIYDLIIEKRIFIITPWKIYDPTNPSDLRQIRFELFMSREEFETTRERLTGGRYNAAMEGKWVSGPAPFGYDYNHETKKLIMNETEAETVRLIFDFYANGIILNNGRRKLVQFRALATYLTRIGIKTPKGKINWGVASLRYLLENDLYIGVLRYNTTQTTTDGKKVPRPQDEHIIVRDAHPPIIDMDTWNRVQYRIENREGTTKTKLDFEPNELAGLCVCKMCGRKFIRRHSKRKYKKKDGSYSVYIKDFLFCGTTGCTYVKFTSIEEDLLETLRFLKGLDPIALEAQLNRIRIEEKPSRAKDDMKEYIKIREEEIKRRMNFIYDKYETGIYTDEMFLERKDELDKELDNLKKVKVDDDIQEERKRIDIKLVKSNLTSILEAYKKADSKSVKNQLLHLVFSQVNIEILEKGRGRKAAVHMIEPYLRSSFFTPESV